MLELKEEWGETAERMGGDNFCFFFFFSHFSGKLIYGDFA